MIIALEGYMGCGKSSVGRELAALLSVPFTDLDEYICSRCGKSIPEIFAERGEEGFRETESQCLLHFLENAPSGCVLALGGGTVLRNAAILSEKTLVVYLKASADTLGKRLEGCTGRPLLGPDWKMLLEERLPLYEKAARITIDTDGLTVKETAGQIISSLS